ncbi:MAG: glutamate mutase L [Deltaproteobacteria bacterium]|nr:glutamate mutase L [Deltaproteobacteria bacterium]
MEAALLIDIGSTFTKACAINLDDEQLLASVSTPSTTRTDICEAIDNAILLMHEAVGEKLDFKIRLASSSAAGGLRIIVVGLVPDLTSQAARLAALGAGAKVISTYSYKLSDIEQKEINKQNPDIMLLVGGTDGGDEETILWNAKILSGLEFDAPIIVAGNKVVSREAERIIKNSGKDAYISENVLPQIGELNVEPVRKIIRTIFIDRIIISKGFEKVNKYIDGVLMPTPTAVFEAVELLSKGTESIEGMGELVAVDIGGATTDVYSMATGRPTKEGTILKGFPPPYSMRTVEGDLGLRSNAISIVEEVGEQRVLENIGIKNIDLRKITEMLSHNTAKIPRKTIDRAIDVGLAISAAQVALERHSGHLETISTPMGMMNVQHGKDLTRIGCLIATGGIFAHHAKKSSIRIFKGALSNREPFSLRPQKPQFYVDTNYIMYGIGLLSKYYPEKAIKVLKKNLSRIDQYERMD